MDNLKSELEAAKDDLRKAFRREEIIKQELVSGASCNVIEINNHLPHPSLTPPPIKYVIHTYIQTQTDWTQFCNCR